MRVSWLFALALSLYHCGGTQASLADDIVEAINNAKDCNSCHELLVPLTGLAFAGDSAFSSTIIQVCKIMKLEDDDVCEGLVSEQGPIIAHDLRSISPFGQTSTKLCEVLFGLCQAPAVNQFKFPLPAAPTNPKKWTSQGRTPFQVAHFSDAHIDRQYTPGADVQCTKPICCRNYADQAGQPISVPAGALGSHNCDTSTGLAESMLRAVSTQGNSFSIFTGDVIEADTWLVNQTGVTSELTEFNQEMQTLISTPVFPAIGNHDTAPVNSFPRSTTPEATSQWVFDTQASGWSKWLGPSATSAVQHMSGSYSVVAPGTNLRIISMNTIYWYRVNYWLFDSDDFQPDPNGVLAFVAQQLQVAETTGQRAWIIAHMSPSAVDALHDQSNYFDQIVQRYKNTIAAQFYGHTHVDEFAISYSDYNNRIAANAVSILYIAPSLTPRDGNPAFKIYDVDPDTYEIMDSRAFISNLTDPIFQTNPQWEQYYSARQVYSPAIPGGWPANASLSAVFWHKVTEAFEKDDALFQKFLELKTRGFDMEVCAPGDCKTNAICALRGGRSEDNCHVAQAGLNLRRGFGYIREESRHAPNQCEGAHLGTVFSQMPGKMVGL
ncbi:sphingomyelin phosphodiesterase [Macrolepiota fuliginosa MF-IS2]|uniref:Sphingomyelin phosphodiesterase n=1 Tax=Macrolepiota fuliginosa MF-IS2 TaxID=1400762 RepID=A0A9P6C5A1_9AGAR|nr:sphingomyelin phosphodiesterase [Macrolepiota fuliginosa MF-IS2]